MSSEYGFDEERAKEALLALARELILREPRVKDKSYRKGWDDLQSAVTAVLMAPGMRLPPDVWRSILDQLTVRKQLGDAPVED